MCRQALSATVNVCSITWEDARDEVGQSTLSHVLNACLMAFSEGRSLYVVAPLGNGLQILRPLSDPRSQSGVVRIGSTVNMRDIMRLALCPWIGRHGSRWPRRATTVRSLLNL